MAEPFETDFPSFFRDLPLAGLIARDDAKKRAFRERYRRELAFVALHMNDLGVTGGEASLHPDPPEACDLCNEGKFGFFIDGETANGAWANMCPRCFMQVGRGIGWGVGQLYRDRGEGRWQCVAGGPPEPTERREQSDLD